MKRVGNGSDDRLLSLVLRCGIMLFFCIIDRPDITHCRTSRCVKHRFDDVASDQQTVETDLPALRRDATIFTPQLVARVRVTKTPRRNLAEFAGLARVLLLLPGR